ncbi:MFS transporter [Microlunatus antarcticus]
MFWGAYTLSELGSAIGTGALPLVAILLLHASSGQVAMLAAAAGLAAAVITIPLGPWVEYHHKRPVMVGADLTRFVALASVPAGWAAGVLSFAQLCVVAAVEVSATIVFAAASGAHLKAFVTPKDRPRAMARLEGSMWSVNTVGPALGGLLIGLLGATVGVAIDAVSYLLSALGIRALRYREPPPPTRQPTKRWLVEVTAGWSYVRRKPVLRALFVNSLVFGGCITASTPLLAVLMLRDLAFTPFQYGLALGLPCLDGVVGAVLVRPLRRRVGERVVLLGSGTARTHGGTRRHSSPGPSGVRSARGFFFDTSRPTTAQRSPLRHRQARRQLLPAPEPLAGSRCRPRLAADRGRLAAGRRRDDCVAGRVIALPCRRPPGGRGADEPLHDDRARRTHLDHPAGSPRRRHRPSSCPDPAPRPDGRHPWFDALDPCPTHPADPSARPGRAGVARTGRHRPADRAASPRHRPRARSCAAGGPDSSRALHARDEHLARTQRTRRNRAGHQPRAAHPGGRRRRLRAAPDRSAAHSRDRDRRHVLRQPPGGVRRGGGRAARHRPGTTRRPGPGPGPADRTCPTRRLRPGRFRSGPTRPRRPSRARPQPHPSTSRAQRQRTRVSQHRSAPGSTAAASRDPAPQTHVGSCRARSRLDRGQHAELLSTRTRARRGSAWTGRDKSTSAAEHVLGSTTRGISRR